LYVATQNESAEAEDERMKTMIVAIRFFMLSANNVNKEPNDRDKTEIAHQLHRQEQYYYR